MTARDRRSFCVTETDAKRGGGRQIFIRLHFDGRMETEKHEIIHYILRTFTEYSAQTSFKLSTVARKSCQLLFLAIVFLVLFMKVFLRL